MDLVFNLLICILLCAGSHFFGLITRLGIPSCSFSYSSGVFVRIGFCSIRFPLYLLSLATEKSGKVVDRWLIGITNRTEKLFADDEDSAARVTDPNGVLSDTVFYSTRCSWTIRPVALAACHKYTNSVSENKHTDR